MALVECTKCGHMISDKARMCPKCGADVKANYILREDPQKSSSNMWWLLAVVVIIAATLLFTFSQKDIDVATDREAETETLSDSGIMQDKSVESLAKGVMTSDVDKTKKASDDELSQKVKDAHSLWAKLSGAGLYSDFKGAQFTIGYYYHNGRVRECNVSILGDYQINEELQANIDDNGNLVCTGSCNYGKIKVVLYPKRIDDTLKGEMTVGNDKGSPIEIYIEEYVD